MASTLLYVQKVEKSSAGIMNADTLRIHFLGTGRGGSCWPQGGPGGPGSLRRRGTPRFTSGIDKVVHHLLFFLAMQAPSIQLHGRPVAPVGFLLVPR
ncbi:unnamed protein product, partial [Heterosigma akashiwo]